jgi:hypothetical protein
MLGIDLTWEHAKPYSLTLFVLTTGWALFDKFLWRLWPLNRFIQTPNLNGTWLAEMQSSYEDPITKEKKGPIYGYVAVKQTFSKLSIRLMTAETESFLLASRFDIKDDGTTYVYGVYQSDPSIHLRGKVSEIHYGSFKYKIVGSPILNLIGHYWTDRNTTGSIILRDKVTPYFGSYDSAELGYKDTRIAKS